MSFHRNGLGPLSEPGDRWARWLYRGNKVWIPVDARDEPIADGHGVVRVRYRRDDAREYGARREELAPATDEALAAIAAARAQRRRRSSVIRLFTAATPDGGVGFVLDADGYRREVALVVRDAPIGNLELLAVRRGIARIKAPDRPLRIQVEAAHTRGVLVGEWEADGSDAIVDAIRRDLERFPEHTVTKAKGDARAARAGALAREAGATGEAVDALIDTTDDDAEG